MNRLADSRRAWLGVKTPVDGIGPGLVHQCRENYEVDLLARIEELMDARANTPEGDELRALADEWVAHEKEYDRAAIADTHAKRGDAKQAPSVMSGGGAEGNRP